MIFSRNNIITLIILFICNDQLLAMNIKITLFNATDKELVIRFSQKSTIIPRSNETFQWIKPNKSITFNLSNVPVDVIPLKFDYSQDECTTSTPYNCGKDLINKETGLIDNKDQQKVENALSYKFSFRPIELTNWDGINQTTIPAGYLKEYKSLFITLTESNQINRLTKSKKIVGNVEKNK